MEQINKPINMKKKVIILGGIGIGLIASYIIDQYNDTEIIGFLNDNEPLGKEIGDYERKIKVVGNTEDIHKFLKDDDTFVFIAYIVMKNKEKVYSKIKSLNIPEDKFINLIHPISIVPKGYCKLGKGVLIAPLAQLSPDTRVGDKCILLANSFLGHNSTMGEFSSIATNSVVGAHVEIGIGVHIGSNATIRETVKIGNYSFVGMGAVVLEDVPDYAIVVGNPAKILRYNYPDGHPLKEV
jgi:acetyltransferase EpsM